MANLERVSLAIEKDLMRRFDRLQKRSGHKNRSEAVRDLIRTRLVEEEWNESDGEVVATVTIVYDHAQRALADRLLATGHHHHTAMLASLHVHLDEHTCLEVAAMRGQPDDLRHLADHLIGMKGVKHGRLVMTSSGV